MCIEHVKATSYLVNKYLLIVNGHFITINTIKQIVTSHFIRKKSISLSIVYVQKAFYLDAGSHITEH